jgi:hypothetical protein
VFRIQDFILYAYRIKVHAINAHSLSFNSIQNHLNPVFSLLRSGMLQLMGGSSSHGGERRGRAQRHNEVPLRPSWCASSSAGATTEWGWGWGRAVEASRRRRDAKIRPRASLYGGGAEAARIEGGVGLPVAVVMDMDLAIWRRNSAPLSHSAAPTAAGSGVAPLLMTPLATALRPTVGLRSGGSPVGPARRRPMEMRRTSDPALMP